MTDRRKFLGLAGLGSFGALFACKEGRAAESFPVQMSTAQWREKLTPAEFRILREDGTERPYSSPLNKEKRDGTYICAGCDNQLYASDTKFESGTGWPSFYRPLDGAIVTEADWSLGMRRTEVRCARCGGHLGHVFNDGPAPTGKRYCMNGAAMDFVPA